MSVVGNMSEGGRLLGDIASAGVVIGTLMQVLPSVAALLTILWTILRIYETFLNVQAKRRAARGDSPDR